MWFTTRFAGKNILKVPEEELCKDPASEGIISAVLITASTLGGTLLLVLLVCLLAYHVRVELHSRWNWHPFDRDECTREDMEYDVFLCCSSEDDLAYGRRVMELLEANNYRVCYHLIHFLPGELIENNIMQSVVKSKRTLCLMSRNFLKRFVNMQFFCCFSDSKIVINYGNTVLYCEL